MALEKLTPDEFAKRYGNAASVPSPYQAPAPAQQAAPAEPAPEAQPAVLSADEFQKKYGNTPTAEQEATPLYGGYTKEELDQKIPDRNSQTDDGIKGGFIGRLFTGNTQKFGKTGGEAFAAPENANLYSDAMQTYSTVQQNLMKAIKTKKAAGQDTSRLEAALDEHTKEAPKLEDFTGDVINKTPEQVLGEAAGTVLEATAGGALESGAKTAVDKTLTTGQKLFKGAKVGAAYGAASGGSNSMQEGNDAGKVLEDTAIGGLIGAGTGGLFEGAAAGLSKVPFLKGKQGAIDHYVNIEKNNFAKPTTLPQEGTYKTANAIYKNAKTFGNDLSDEAVKSGIRHDSIIQDGKYASIETAAQLRDDAIKASNETIRPALAAAEGSTQRVPITKIRSQMIDDINAIPKSQIQDKDREIMIRRVQQKYAPGSAADLAHPDGFSLTDLHDNKIAANNNGKFKRDGAHSENILAQQNRAEGSVFKKILEDTAPDELDIKKFNNAIQGKFQLADYLEALNGKKVPKGIVAKAVDSLGKIAGARLGYQFGGGLLPGAIGYHLGGVLLDTFQYLPNPAKAHYLSQLAIEQPAVFKEFQNFIGKEEVAKLLRKALPEGRIFSGTPDVINLPAEGILEGQRKIKQ